MKKITNPISLVFTIVFTFFICLNVNSQKSQEFFNKGNEMLKSADYISARRDFSVAIRLNHKYAEAYNLRGVSKLLVNGGTSLATWQEVNASIKDFNKAIKINPNFADPYNNRGLAKRCSNDYWGAIQDYNTAIKLNSNYAEAYFNRGNSK